MTESSRRHFTLIVAALAFLGCASLPYGFYMILRVAVCSWAVWTLICARPPSESPWTWFLVCLALLYNPIIKVHLGRELWVAANIFTGIGLLAYHRTQH
ncbi:DUF6804 family protein [Prosthecobacter sp.]|uniref:DUF6804 family protein n=1 Tax=Prosthecobacter sp. TaxID=1965333 RepID=UPI00378423D5